MAGNGSKSGDGKASPFSGDGGGGAKGVDFLKNPSGTSGGSGNNYLTDPSGAGVKTGAQDFRANPGGDVDIKQKSGSYRNDKSIPSGGTTPMVKGGAEPAASRTTPKDGYSAGSNPGAGPDRKPYKVK